MCVWLDRFQDLVMTDRQIDLGHVCKVGLVGDLAMGGLSTCLPTSGVRPTEGRPLTGGFRHLHPSLELRLEPK